ARGSPGPVRPGSGGPERGCPRGPGDRQRSALVPRARRRGRRYTCDEARFRLYSYTCEHLTREVRPVSDNGASVVNGTTTVLARRPTNPYFDRELLADWVRDKSDPRQKKYQCVTFTLSHESRTGWYVLTPANVPKSSSADEREYA